MSITGKDQSQSINDGGQAIQAGRDVTIHQGQSEAQLLTLITHMAEKLAYFHQAGQRHVDERLEEFKKEVFLKLDEKSSDGIKPEALQDPDFQHVLRETQESYVRSDDASVNAALIDLLAERSRRSRRDRVTLSLNAALETVAHLTSEEIARITIAFMMRRTTVTTPELWIVVDHIKKHIVPAISEAGAGQSSSEYLIASGCASLIPFGGGNLFETFRQSYQCVFSDGCKKPELVAIFPNRSWTEVQRLLRQKSIFSGPVSFVSAGLAATISSPPDDQTLWFNFSSGHNVAEQVRSWGWTSDEQTAVGNFCGNKAWSEDKVKSLLINAVPQLKGLENVWSDGMLGQLNPTSLGLTIAHSNAKRLWPTFDAPLEVWVN